MMETTHSDDLKVLHQTWSVCPVCLKESRLAVGSSASTKFGCDARAGHGHVVVVHPIIVMDADPIDHLSQPRVNSIARWLLLVWKSLATT